MNLMQSRQRCLCRLNRFGNVEAHNGVRDKLYNQICILTTRVYRLARGRYDNCGYSLLRGTFAGADAT
jgi:hypothetical protein